jgi:hypothetical protein
MQNLNRMPRWLSAAAALVIIALAGSCSGGTVTITPGVDPPLVTISGLDENETIYSDRHVSIVATDPDGVIRRLRVWLDGEQVFSQTYSRAQVVEDFLVYGDAFSAGWHTLEAIATDDDGNTDRDFIDYRVAP